MDEVNLSVYLHIYSYLSEYWKYEWRYSGEGIQSLAATGDVELWRPQQRSGGGESVFCMQTHFHMDMVKPVQLWTSDSEKQPRGNKYIYVSISALYQSWYTAFVSMDI